MTGSTLLITGANGFIGGVIGRAWQARGGSVVGLVRLEARADAATIAFPIHRRPLTPDEVRSAIEHFSPDAVLHAAGTASVGASLADPATDYAASVATAHAALEGIRRSRRRPRFLFPSSAAVYGEPATLPVAETAPIRPLSPYGYHKAMAELLIQEYARCFDVPVLIFRLFSVFGAHQRRLLVHELFERFSRDAIVTVQGTGEEMRDFLHEDDMAAAVLGLLPRIHDPAVVINLATGEGTRVAAVATTMRHLLKSSKEIRYGNAAQPGNPSLWTADISALRAHAPDLDYATAVDFERRLAATLHRWMQDGRSAGLP
jgi:UDP-glucose 4-epimerase